MCVRALAHRALHLAWLSHPQTPCCHCSQAECPSQGQRRCMSCNENPFPKQTAWRPWDRGTACTGSHACGCTREYRVWERKHAIPCLCSAFLTEHMEVTFKKQVTRIVIFLPRNQCHHFGGEVGCLISITNYRRFLSFARQVSTLHLAIVWRGVRGTLHCRHPAPQ